MNLAQSLGAAAAALVMGLSASGVAPAQTVSEVVAEARARLEPGAIRGAVEELATMLEQRYVFPETGRQYAEHLRTQAAAGAYDGANDPQQLAAQLTGELNSIHRDAHLRVTLSDGSEPGRRVLRAPPGDEAFGEAQWLADGVAYLRINMIPGDDASEVRMGQILDQYADADALILDLRTCRGGSTSGVMDVIFSRLFARPTQLITMDTRRGADLGAEEMYANQATLREVRNAPRNIRRWQQWAQPTTPVSALADARVFLLTDETASGCEHLALALKEAGRATLIGATTRGAGHYGSDVAFGPNGQLQVFIPVGRTYIERTGQGWEGVGVAPDRQTAPQEALNEALRELRVTPNPAAQALARVRAPREAVRIDGAASATRRYGIGTAIEPGADSFAVMEVAPGLAAERGGLQAGDRIVSVNGSPVSTLTPDAFSAAMRASPLTLEVLRGTERMTFRISLDG